MALTKGYRISWRISHSFFMKVAHKVNFSVTVFCSLQCLVQYVTYEVMSSAYDISCPDPECEKQGVMHMSEIENLVGKELTDKHKMFRLNTGK